MVPYRQVQVIRLQGALGAAEEHAHGVRVVVARVEVGVVADGEGEVCADGALREEGGCAEGGVVAEEGWVGRG